MQRCRDPKKGLKVSKEDGRKGRHTIMEIEAEGGGAKPTHGVGKTISID